MPQSVHSLTFMFSPLRLEIAQPTDMQRVWEHFLYEYCPAEPLFRSIGTFTEKNLSTMGGRITKWALKKYYIQPLLNNGCSIIALNAADEIIGQILIKI